MGAAIGAIIGAVGGILSGQEKAAQARKRSVFEAEKTRLQALTGGPGGQFVKMPSIFGQALGGAALGGEVGKDVELGGGTSSFDAGGGEVTGDDTFVPDFQEDFGPEDLGITGLQPARPVAAPRAGASVFEGV